jgi:sugar phosphate isomerase/epimerase
LRAGHAHGVELGLAAPERAEVRARFQDSPVELVGLGSAYEFHSNDPAEVRRNVEEAKAYAQLAADVGAGGVKLRPNGVPDGEEIDAVCERIGCAWDEVAAAAADLGVETRMEVHGHRTADPAVFLTLLEHARRPNAKVCWNSNPDDMDEHQSIASFFERVKARIGTAHITDIGSQHYPWQDLFNRLKGMGYAGFCLAEIQANPDPARFMAYYRTLFDLYAGEYAWPRDGWPPTA